MILYARAHLELTQNVTEYKKQGEKKILWSPTEHTGSRDSHALFE